MTIYKTLSGFFIVATLLPGRRPSLCYFSPLGKRGVMRSYISVYPLVVHRFLIYEQGTPVFDFGTAQSGQIGNLQSLIDVRYCLGIINHRFFKGSIARLRFMKNADPQRTRLKMDHHFLQDFFPTFLIRFGYSFPFTTSTSCYVPAFMFPKCRICLKL